MPKAFLSHSSVDKHYVEAVARRLSRANVIFDKWCFEPGEDFRSAIRHGLEQSDVFVLFASRAALESPWVQFEMDEAEMRRLQHKLSTVLVLTLGHDMSFSSLPIWLKRALVVPAPGAAQTARLIQEKLVVSAEVRQQHLFVGREDDIRALSEQVASYGLDVPPVMVFSGLDGVGRRTLARNFLKDHMNLGMGPVLDLFPNQGLDDLYLAFLDENMEFFSRSEIVDSLSIFREMKPEERAMEIARQVSLFSRYNVAPVIWDRGALLADDGTYTEDFSRVMLALRSFPGATLLVIQNRHPRLYFPTSDRRHVVAPTRVRPLGLDSIQRLLQHSLRVNGVPATANQILELSSYLDGYPPAVSFATTIARDYYGMDNLLADKTLLVDFKAGAFTHFLKTLKLNSDQERILKVLASVPSASQPVLATMLGVQEPQVAVEIRPLIDANVILHVDGRLAVASPVKDAVWRLWGNPTMAEFAAFAQRLKEKFWDGDGVPELTTIEVTVYSLLRGERDEDLAEFAGLVMPSTILKAARAAYDNKEWLRARQLAEQVLRLDPDRDDARVILFKALVRDGEPSDDVLKELRNRNHKLQHYLAGFRAWKRGDHRKAVKHYRDALEAGDRSNSVYRELAECQYWLGDYASASRNIQVVLDRGKPNPFVLDLAAKIATTMGDYDGAERYINVQQLVDRAENVAHRRASLAKAKGQWWDALRYATIACRREPPLPETFFLKTHILIELGQWRDADLCLKEIQERFRGVKPDVQCNLRCQLHLRQGEWGAAEEVFNQAPRRETPENIALRVQIMKQKSVDPALSPIERRRAAEVLANLSNHLDEAALLKVFDPVWDD